MTSHQHTEVALPISFWQPLQTISTMSARLGKRLRKEWQAARQERVVARLPPHLRYDIGEIDCRPVPAPAARRNPESLSAVARGSAPSLTIVGALSGCRRQPT